MADTKRLDPVDAFALLGDDYARTILAALSHEPMTATELGTQCEMSVATVYRRLESLEQCGLAASRTTVDPDGHHHELYEARLEELRVRLTDGEFDVRLVTDATTHTVADTFTDLWEGL